jgi:hypothetical protein
VVVTGSITTLKVVDSRKVELSDPAIPESRQPYHAGFGTARNGGPELSRLVKSVQRFGQHSVTELLQHCNKSGYRLRGTGIVVGSLIDPKRIGNEHIRIHALEGQLFRRVVEQAAARSNLSCSIWRDRDLYASAVKIFKRPERELRSTLVALGKTVPGSWRAEQKSAALAACLALARRVSTGQRAKVG